MYLTMIEHEGLAWVVTLRVEVRAREPGTLWVEFRRLECETAEHGYEAAGRELDELFTHGSLPDDDYLRTPLVRARRESAAAPA